MDVLSEEHKVDTEWALDILGVMTRAKGQHCRGFDGMFLEMLIEYLGMSFHCHCKFICLSVFTNER